VEGHERDDAEEVQATVEVDLRGLSLFTHHGVSEAEREIGQRLEIDITLEVADCDAVLTDRVEDTVDYAELTDVVVLAASERSYRTLERVAHVIAERLAESFDCESLRVRVAKPEPPLPVAIGEAAVEVAWHRASDEDEGGGGEETG
jgi:7,8-dihydroneopterin aldolase/epimerase/oxygenase